LILKYSKSDTLRLSWTTTITHSSLQQTESYTHTNTHKHTHTHTNTQTHTHTIDRMILLAEVIKPDRKYLY